MITDEQLAEWERLCETLRPGPWEQFICKYEAVDCGESPQVFRSPQRPEYNPVGYFFDAWVCAARTAMPALIDEVRRLRRLVPRDLPPEDPTVKDPEPFI